MTKLKISESTVIYPNKEITVDKISEKFFLLKNQSLGYKLKVDGQVINLLKILDRPLPLKSLHQLFNKAYESTVSLADIQDLIENKLAGYGVVIIDGYYPSSAKRRKSVIFNYDIIPAKYANTFSGYLSFLFAPGVTASVFLTFSLLLFLNIYLNFSQFISLRLNDVSLSSIIVIYIIVALVTLMIHELGHASACKYYNLDHGAISLGFYLVLPAVFTDTSSAWKLKNRQRVLVNLGGIYFEIVLNCFLLFFSLVTGNFTIFLVSLIFLTSTLFTNLNPFFSTDGYWVLVDYFDIPNLRQKAFSIVRMVMQGVLQEKRLPKLDGKELLTGLYGFTSLILIGLLIIITFSRFYEQTIFYPFHLYNLILNYKDILNKNLAEIVFDILPSIVIPFGFYLFSYHNLKNFLFKRKEL